MERKLRNNIKKETGKSKNVLIPVDFSSKCNLAINVGFELARRLERNVTLLHASNIAFQPAIPEFPDEFNGIDNENAEIEEIEIGEEIHAADEKSFSELKKSISNKEKEGTLPTIPYEIVLTPGMPEEVIKEYCAVTPPEVIVMACRGREKRHSDLIGSVTAEVIDSCIATVLTVPEEYTFSGFKEIVRICAFCYFDEGDFECISKLMSMFDSPEVQIYLFPATDKLKLENLLSSLYNLQRQLGETFPKSEFKVGFSGTNMNLREEVELLFRKKQIQMVLAPNRRRNFISRLFNPGLPHKILYEIDIPLLSIPV